jgi:hypothetical protein
MFQILHPRSYNGDNAPVLSNIVPIAEDARYSISELLVSESPGDRGQFSRLNIQNCCRIYSLLCHHSLAFPVLQAAMDQQLVLWRIRAP